MAENRVRSVVAKANQKLSIQWAALLLSASTLISSLLGIYRDRLLNGLYLDSYPVGIDAYTVAFTIPDFMFFILVSGALSVTFIPVFNQRLGTGNRKSAWELSSSLINFMALVTLIASILIIIFAEPLVRYVVGPGLDESGRGLAVSMMRIIAVNPFLFAVATVIASMQQAVGRFTFYALAPTIYNIGIIIGAQFFTEGINMFGWQVFDGGIMGVALGVVLGSVMQLVVSSIGLIGLGFDYEMKIKWKNQGFRQVLRLLPARSLDQGIDYVNGLVETNLASHMADGTIRAYQQALSLSLMPVSLIGVAISNAAFPRMTERLGQGRPDLFRRELLSILRWIVWLTLPVVTITFFARGFIVSFIKNGGNALIAGLLGALVLSILFRTIYHIAARAFYAQQDTRTPLYVSIFSIALNIGLAVTFTSVLGWGVNGLAWAQSLVALVEVLILCSILAVRIPKLFHRKFWHAIMRMIAASALMALITYGSVLLFQLQSSDMTFFSTFPKFGVIVAVSFATYVGLSKLFHLTEADPVIRRVNALLFGKK
ncbi:polysaccharide biosynthesis protein [Candidatus Saccharibacteria bacterium]|nr:MAG: polysaccharide biosynthesis protein [Candidatus Saccharibacteria bacterium]